MSRTIVPFVLMLSLLSMASQCQTQSTLSHIREAHTIIRESFVQTDDFVSPRFEARGDECIAQGEAQGLTGQALVDASNECMGPWLRLDEIIATVRESLAELENVYEDIENGREADWQRIAVRIVDHAHSILAILDELNIDEADSVVAEIRHAVDLVCQITHCEGE